MRLIDADALLQRYDEVHVGPPGGARKLIEEAPTADGWISVKDRLPENERIVIGYTPVDGYMFIGFYRTWTTPQYDWSAWYIITSLRSTKKITKKATHWMPLPEPPKEGEVECG